MCYFPENTCFEAEFQKRPKKKTKQIMNDVHFIWGSQVAQREVPSLTPGGWWAAAGF